VTTAADGWTRTCREFCRIAAREGVREIAEQVPVDPRTVYRMMRGEVERPSNAVRAGVERIVANHQQED
jgi:hypothetical protein